MKYTPLKDRVIVKVLKSSFEKTKGGILVDQEDLKTESKNNLIRVTLVKLGEACEELTEEDLGTVVLIHEITGVPMHGIDSDFRVLREDDIWCKSGELPEETLTLGDTIKNSDFAKDVNKS